MPVAQGHITCYSYRMAVQNVAPASLLFWSRASQKRAQGSLMQRRLFVGNLPWSVMDADLSDLVSAHAKVLDTKIITDYETGRSRGFGFVTVETENVQDLIRKLNGQTSRGARSA
jgi:RNA recognition motif-containing protein